MIPISSCSCLWPIHWSQVLSLECRCSWSSADRRCSNYIWVIDNFIAHKGATYIRDLTVHYVWLNQYMVIFLCDVIACGSLPIMTSSFDTLRPEHNGHHFADNIKNSNSFFWPKEQQAMTWSYVDQVLWCHMVSLGHNVLINIFLFVWKVATHLVPAWISNYIGYKV